MTPDKLCEICGNWYSRGNRIPPIQFLKSRFCSIKCRGVWSSQTFVGSKSTNWKGGKSLCKDCGKELAARYSFRKTTYCRNCWSKHYKGENSPSWTGGLPKCIDCNKQIYRGQKRCATCYHKTHSGKNSPVYKEKLEYKYLHDLRIKQVGNPTKCEHCGTLGKKAGRNWNIQWANKTGKYLREHSDWIGLCSKCHRIYDLQNNSIKSYK